MTFVRQDHLGLAEHLGCLPSVQGESIAKQFLGALYPIYLAISVREKSTVVAVCRDVLRKNAEGCA